MNVERTYNSRLIYLPQQQGRATRTLYGVATFLAWAFYLYLWLPLTTLALWMLGVRFAYLEVYLLNEPLQPPAMLRELPLIALVCAIVLIGWAEYNRHRFRGKERRHPQDNTGHAEIAKALHASRALSVALFGARTAVLEMDPRGRPLEIQVNHSLDDELRPQASDVHQAPALTP